MDLTRALEATAGIADPSILRRLGIEGRALQRALRSGQLIKLRRGRYAVPTVHPHVASAVRAGGRVACVSALRMYGVWVLADDGEHVRIARGVDAVVGPRMRVHWSDERGWGHPIDSPAFALTTAVHCLPLRHAVVVADSAVNKRILSLDEMARVLASTPRGRRILRLLDPQSESGLETLARLALRGRGIRLRSQVQIAGVGRVDLVIGDRLVLELDGESWHGDFESDRARDRALIALGYVVMRVSYRQLLEDWNAIEVQVLALVRRREHLWRGPHAALGHAVRGYRASKSDGSR
jgi:very-short-patch-repair endonuclease